MAFDGYTDHYIEHGINPAYEQALADRSPIVEYDPVLPELGPVEQGTQDAYDGTPDYTRASGDPVYRVTLIRTLLMLSAPARRRTQHGPGAMTNATGMTFDEAWAESGAPSQEEW